MTIAELIKQYAKRSHTSVVSIERRMGWASDTVRKMTLPTDKNRARVQNLAATFVDLFDIVPELRSFAGEAGNIRDVRIEGLEALVEQQKETIRALREQVDLLKILAKIKKD